VAYAYANWKWIHVEGEISAAAAKILRVVYTVGGFHVLATYDIYTLQAQVQ
jgi:hypothetical protein